MLPSCLTPCKYKYRERRSHFLALSKDNHAQSGVPSQIRGRPGVTGGQPVLCRIVAVGWPGPVAVLVLFARSSKEKVTAHPPPGSPDYARGRRCLSAERRISPFINRDIFSSFPSGENEKSKSFFHALKATLDRLADRLLMYALDLGNFLDALSENDVGINPAALDLRQRVECIP